MIDWSLAVAGFRALAWLEGALGCRTRADFRLLIDCVATHSLDLTFELDHFVRQVSILNLKLLH